MLSNSHFINELVKVEKYDVLFMFLTCFSGALSAFLKADVDIEICVLAFSNL